MIASEFATLGEQFLVNILQIFAFPLSSTKHWQQDQEKHEFAFDSLQLLYNSGKCLSKRK